MFETTEQMVEKGLKAFKAGDRKHAESWWLKAVGKNDPAAVYWLGLYYYRQENERAAKYFAQAATGGYPLGSYMYGQCLYSGIGITKNEEQGQKFIDKAKQNLRPEDLYDLAMMFYEGQGVVQEYADAINIFAEAERMGHPQAKVMLDKSREKYNERKKARENFQKRADALYERSNQGDVQAEYDLANLYFFEDSPLQNKKYGIELFEHMANNGLSFGAMRFLGVCYWAGDGVPKDKQKALDWLQKAAEFYVSTGAGDSSAKEFIHAIENGKETDGYKKDASGLFRLTY